MRMKRLKAWAAAPPRPWVVKYMLGLLAVGVIWTYLDVYWPDSVASKVVLGVLMLYMLSLKPVLALGPKSKKFRSSR